MSEDLTPRALIIFTSVNPLGLDSPRSILAREFSSTPAFFFLLAAGLGFSSVLRSKLTKYDQLPTTLLQNSVYELIPNSPVINFCFFACDQPLICCSRFAALYFDMYRSQ